MKLNVFDLLKFGQFILFFWLYCIWFSILMIVSWHGSK